MSGNRRPADDHSRVCRCHNINIKAAGRVPGFNDAQACLSDKVHDCTRLELSAGRVDCLGQFKRDRSGIVFARDRGIAEHFLTIRRTRSRRKCNMVDAGQCTRGQVNGRFKPVKHPQNLRTLIRCPKDFGGTNHSRVTGANGQIDAERCAFANRGAAGKGQDVLGSADNIDPFAGAGRPQRCHIIDGRRAVDARVKAGTFAIKLVHMGQRQIGDRGHAIGRLNAVSRTAWQLFVAFIGQQDRVVQFDGCRRHTTNHADRTTDGIHAFVKGRKYLGIATVNDFVINRQNRDCLCLFPVACIKADILAQCHGTVAVHKRAANRLDFSGGSQNCPLVGQHLNSDDSPIDADIIQTCPAVRDAFVVIGLNISRQFRRERCKAVTFCNGLAVKLADKGNIPCLANGGDACEFDLEHIVEVKVRHRARQDRAAGIGRDCCFDKETWCRISGPRDLDRVTGQDGLVAGQGVDLGDQAIADVGKLVIRLNSVLSGERVCLVGNVVIQRDRPYLALDNRPGKGQFGDRGGNANLNAVGFAKVGGRIKGQIAIVGPGLERGHINGNPLVADQRAGQHDIKAIGDAVVVFTAFGQIGGIAALDDFDRWGVIVQKLQIKGRRCGLFFVLACDVIIILKKGGIGTLGDVSRTQAQSPCGAFGNNASDRRNRNGGEIPIAAAQDAQRVGHSAVLAGWRSRVWQTLDLQTERRHACCIGAFEDHDGVFNNLWWRNAVRTCGNQFSNAAGRQRYNGERIATRARHIDGPTWPHRNDIALVQRGDPLCNLFADAIDAVWQIRRN